MAGLFPLYNQRMPCLTTRGLYNDSAPNATTAIAASDKDPCHNKDESQDKEDIFQPRAFNVDHVGECQDPHNNLGVVRSIR